MQYKIYTINIKNTTQLINRVDYAINSINAVNTMNTTNVIQSKQCNEFNIQYKYDDRDR